jgi:hypothetical protein
LHLDAKAVPLAFGRRVSSAKGAPSTPGQSSQSPPQQPLFQHYPSSPQTPTTRLAAKAKGVLFKIVFYFIFLSSPHMLTSLQLQQENQVLLQLRVQFLVICHV